jgi:sugar phosphate isomerase/epimerase
MTKERDVADELFSISLAQWSHHRKYRVEGRDPLEFASVARSAYDIGAVEYLNTFYQEHKHQQAYLKDLKQVADDNGVTSVLIMVDYEGKLGHPDVRGRDEAVENHKIWLEWAAYLGCSAIRVNAWGDGTYTEQAEQSADGLRKLGDVADGYGLDVLVENHGYQSGNPMWVKAVMQLTDHPRVGVLPDANGFFRYAGDIPGRVGERWDRYVGLDDLMPWVRAISANMRVFDEDGNEADIDYRRFLDIAVNRHGFRGYVGVEYEGKVLSEDDGVHAARDLLLKIRDEMSSAPANA